MNKLLISNRKEPIEKENTHRKEWQNIMKYKFTTMAIIKITHKDKLFEINILVITN